MTCAPFRVKAAHSKARSIQWKRKNALFRAQFPDLHLLKWHSALHSRASLDTCANISAAACSYAKVQSTEKLLPRYNRAARSPPFSHSTRYLSSQVAISREFQLLSVSGLKRMAQWKIARKKHINSQNFTVMPSYDKNKNIFKTHHFSLFLNCGCIHLVQSASRMSSRKPAHAHALNLYSLSVYARMAPLWMELNKTQHTLRWTGLPTAAWECIVKDDSGAKILLG